MFSRQWFSENSQVGITEPALKFEQALRNHNFKNAKQIILENYDTVSAMYWDRMWARLKWLYSMHQFRRMNIRYFCYGFWPSMDPTNCQLLDLFKMAQPSLSWHIVEEPQHADIVFFSCYSNDYQSVLASSKQALHILFLGENVRPYFSDFDFSLTFDQCSYFCRNVYFPLWLMEINWFNKSKYPDRHTYSIDALTSWRAVDHRYREDAVCYIGNNYEPFRTTALSIIEQAGVPVHRYGSHSRPVRDKLGLLMKYRYTLCFENSYYPGYTTEKPVHSYLAGCQSIYWGCPDPVLCINENPLFFCINYFDDIRNLALRIRGQSEYLLPNRKYEPFVSKEALDKRISFVIQQVRLVLAQFITIVR